MEKAFLWTVGIVSFIIAKSVSHEYPAFGATLFLLFLIAIFGTFYANAYMRGAERKGRISEKWLNFLFWSNTLSWIFPIFGVFTAIVTLNINAQNNGEDHTKFKSLAIFCLVMSVANSYLGAVLLANVQS